MKIQRSYVIDIELYKRVRDIAAATGKSVSQIIEEALRMYIRTYERTEETVSVLERAEIKSENASSNASSTQKTAARKWIRHHCIKCGRTFDLQVEAQKCIYCGSEEIEIEK